MGGILREKHVPYLKLLKLSNKIIKNEMVLRATDYIITF